MVSKTIGKRHLRCLFNKRLLTGLNYSSNLNIISLKWKEVRNKSKLHQSKYIYTNSDKAIHLTLIKSETCPVGKYKATKHITSRLALSIR